MSVTRCCGKRAYDRVGALIVLSNADSVSTLLMEQRLRARPAQRATPDALGQTGELSAPDHGPITL